MGSPLSPLDFLINSQQGNTPAPTAAQPPQVTPAQTSAPSSPLASLPGYNDAIAQQAASYLGANLGRPKTPHDYMLEAMGVAPGQDDDKTKKQKLLKRLGVVGQVLAGRNFANEGQQKYDAMQKMMAETADERAKQQSMGFQQAQLDRSLASPYIAKDAELGYQKKLQDQKFAYGKQKLEYLQSLPLWEGLPDIAKANITAQTFDLKGAAIPASMQRSQTIKVSAAGLDPTVRQTYGLPEQGPVTILQDPLTHHITGAYAGWAGNGTAYDDNGNGFLFDKANPNVKNYIPGAKNPSFAKTTRTEYKTITTNDADGNPVTELVPVSVSSQKGGGSTPTPAAALISAQEQAPPPAQSMAPPSPVSAPGGIAPTPYGATPNSLPPQQPAPVAPPAPLAPPRQPAASAIRQAAANSTPGGTPGGTLSFVKPYTVEQRVKAQQQLGNLDQSITRIQRIQSNLSALNSLIDSKKIEMQIDPKQGIMHAVINRNVPLSDKESQLAADYQSMMEDINMLRGPLGATGFRGPEAFAALTGQAGHLMANPAVTAKVLSNTLENFKSIRNPIATQLNRRNGKKAPSTATTGILDDLVSQYGK